MAIFFNVTLVTCSHPQCKEYLTFQGPRVGSNLVEAEMRRFGWIEDPVANGTNGHHYCKAHAPQPVNNVPVEGKAIDHRDRGPGY